MVLGSKNGVRVESYLDIPADIGHYTADSTVLWCSDLRFRNQRKGLIYKMSLLYPDPLILPGGLRHVFAPEKDGDEQFVIRMAIKLAKAHNSGEILSFGHIGCAGCKDLMVSCSPEEEFDRLAFNYMPRGMEVLRQGLYGAYKEGILSREVLVSGFLGGFDGLHRIVIE